MRLGIIHNDCHEDSFRYAKSKGLDFIEICRNYDKDEDFLYAHLDAVKRGMAETGVKVGSLGRWNATVMKDGGIDPVVVARVKKLIDTAHELDCPVFNIGVNYDDTITRFQNYKNTIAYLSDLVEYAKQYGITVCVYNCSWNNWVHTAEQWDVILPEIPDLKIKFDCSHAFNRGEDYLNLIYKYGNRIGHMHIKGEVAVAGKTIDDPPAGMDDIKWRSVFATLYNVGYDGSFSLEPHSSTWSGELGDKGVDFTLNFIRPFILR